MPFLSLSIIPFLLHFLLAGGVSMASSATFRSLPGEAHTLMSTHARPRMSLRYSNVKIICAKWYESFGRQELKQGNLNKAV